MGKLTCGKPLKEVNAEYIKSAVELFKNLSDNGFETRSKTWNDCHKCFGDIHGSLKKSGYSRTLSKDEKKMARLYLMNYLASWGMYRGSSFVLQYDGKIYDKVIETIFDKSYDLLWDISYNDLKNSLQNTQKNVKDLIVELIDKINGILKVQRDFTYFEKIGWTGNGTSGKVSKTLITKILLGTICCMPALDTNFNAIVGHSDKLSGDDDALKAYDDALEDYLDFLFKMILNKGNLLDYDYDYNLCGYNVFEKLSQDHPEYPLMKIVDMAFFTIGDEKKFKKLFEKYVLKGEVPANNEEWNEWVKLIKHFYYKIDNNSEFTLNVAFLFNATDYINNNKFIEICKKLGCKNPTKKEKIKNDFVDVLDLNKLMEKYINKYKSNIASALERLRKKQKKEQV